MDQLRRSAVGYRKTVPPVPFSRKELPKYSDGTRHRERSDASHSSAAAPLAIGRPAIRRVGDDENGLGLASPGSSDVIYSRPHALAGPDVQDLPQPFAAKDNFEAVALRDWLAREGWDDVFLDLDPERGIAAGERWERALHEQANRCEAVIFLVSANWLASGWCLREYTLARTLNKKLFAVVIDPTKSIADLPPELKGTWQAVDLTGGQDGVLLPTQLPGSHEEKHVVFSKDGLRRLKRGLDKAGLDPKFFAWPPEGDRERAPYRGLKSLEAADAGVFRPRRADRRGDGQAARPRSPPRRRGCW